MTLAVIKLLFLRGIASSRDRVKIATTMSASLKLLSYARYLRMPRYYTRTAAAPALASWQVARIARRQAPHYHWSSLQSLYRIRDMAQYAHHRSKSTTAFYYHYLSPASTSLSRRSRHAAPATYGHCTAGAPTGTHYATCRLMRLLASTKKNTTLSFPHDAIIGIQP